MESVLESESQSRIFHWISWPVIALYAPMMRQFMEDLWWHKVLWSVYSSCRSSCGIVGELLPLVSHCLLRRHLLWCQFLESFPVLSVTHHSLLFVALFGICDQGYPMTWKGPCTFPSLPKENELRLLHCGQSALSGMAIDRWSEDINSSLHHAMLFTGILFKLSRPLLSFVIIQPSYQRFSGRVIHQYSCP